MPESRKRKVEQKDTSKQKHYDFGRKKGGKILLVVLCASMVAGIAFAAVYLMITYLLA